MKNQCSVYISGPMTGYKDLNFPAFNNAASVIRAAGYEAVNPAELNPDTTASWQQCMKTDIAALMSCDVLVLLSGWEQSGGAHLELHLAHRVGITVFTLEDFKKQIIIGQMESA